MLNRTNNFTFNWTLLNQTNNFTFHWTLLNLTNNFTFHWTLLNLTNNFTFHWTLLNLTNNLTLQCTMLNMTWPIMFTALVKDQAQVMKNVKTKPYHLIRGKLCIWYVQAICPPSWDGASCPPPTLAGQTAVWPCMGEYGGSQYDTSGRVWGLTVWYIR